MDLGSGKVRLHSGCRGSTVLNFFECVLIHNYIFLGYSLSGTSSGTGETSGGRAGFATNFGSGIAGTGTRGIEGTIVGCTLKSLITRLVDSKEELLTLENEVSFKVLCLD